MAMTERLPTRAVFAAIALTCVGLLATGYQLQYGPQYQQPCPYCILQRYAYMAIAMISLIATVHGPSRLGGLAYAIAIDICASAGLAFTGLQLSKSSLAESCLADPVAEFVNTLPSANWWPEYLFATGGCGAKFPPILGLSVPVWSMIWFAIIATGSAYLIVLALRRR